MKQVYVTVGSGSFDQLITAVDCCFTEVVNNQLELEFCCQIGKGKVKPSLPYFRFSDDFRTFYQNAAVIITHGVAGTVFELLDMGKKIVLVPNTFRLDKHQQDLAWFIEQHRYGVVCHSLDTLADCVTQALEQDFVPYKKEPFFMADELLDFLSND